MKAPRDYQEGPDAAKRFETALGQILSVSKAELLKREAAWKKARKAKKVRAKKSA